MLVIRLGVRNQAGRVCPGVMARLEEILPRRVERTLTMNECDVR